MKTAKSSNQRTIVVNGRFLSQPITGVQRYAFELLRSLDCLLTAGELTPAPVRVLVPPNANSLPYYSFLRIERVGRSTGHLWEQCELPIFARHHLLFTPCGGSPILHIPHVLTIHDAAVFHVPHAYTGAYRIYYKALHRRLARTSAHVLTVSEFSKRELMQYLNLKEDRISVTYLSGEHILRCDRNPTVLVRHGLDKQRYVFAVGSKNPTKNLAGLARACPFLPSERIVVAGGANTRIFGDTQSPLHSVTELGFVNDSELRTLYENAACLVFPSFYEGFGLPPLEALTLGCPLVLARSASLPEIFGKAAVYCDPYSPRDIAERIAQVLNGQHPDRNFNLKYAAQFTWERCARATWEVLSRFNSL